jgi:hypothetical protein
MLLMSGINKKKTSHIIHHGSCGVCNIEKITNFNGIEFPEGVLCIDCLGSLYIAKVWCYFFRDICGMPKCEGRPIGWNNKAINITDE